MKKYHGFTLVELLVCVAILATVLLVFAGAYRGARREARDAQRIADVKQLVAALKLYYSDCESYPVQTVVLGGEHLSSGGSSCAGGGFLPPPAPGLTYLKDVPEAPKPADNCSEKANEYVYTGTASSYALTFCLGRENSGLPAGLRTATQNGIR